MKRILIALALALSINTFSATLECAAFCIGKYAQDGDIVSNSDWLQVTGSAKNLKGAIEEMKLDCHEKLKEKAAKFTKEYGSNYEVKSIGSIFTKYKNGHIFLPNLSCMKN